MSKDDEMTPEKERRITAKFLGHSGGAGQTVVETRNRRRREFQHKPHPRIEIITGHDDYEEHFEFWLVCGDQRVEIGWQFEREEVVKRCKKIQAMGVEVEWLHG